MDKRSSRDLRDAYTSTARFFLTLVLFNAGTFDAHPFVASTLLPNSLIGLTNERYAFNFWIKDLSVLWRFSEFLEPQA